MERDMWRERTFHTCERDKASVMNRRPVRPDAPNNKMRVMMMSAARKVYLL